MTSSDFRLVQGQYTIEKDPDAILVYGFDLVLWLAGEDLLSLDVIGEGVDVVSSGIVGTRVLAQVSGGEAGKMARATFRFTTTSGARDDRTMRFKLVER